MEQDRPDFSVDKVRARRRTSEAFEQPYNRSHCEVRRLANELEKEIERRRGAEARLAEAQRIAHVGHWDWNIVTNEFYWSDEMYRIFGLPPQAFTVSYLAFLESIHPDDRTLVTQAVNRALFHGEAYSIDHRIIRRDGEVRIVREQGETSRDKRGNPFRTLGSVHDVTDSRLAGQELRRLTAHQIRVREQERGLVASQLHDDIGQTLIAALMQVNAIRKALADSRAGILMCADLEELMRYLQAREDPQLRISGIPARLTRWHLQHPSLVQRECMSSRRVFAVACAAGARASGKLPLLTGDSSGNPALPSQPKRFSRPVSLRSFSKGSCHGILPARDVAEIILFGLGQTEQNLELLLKLLRTERQGAVFLVRQTEREKLEQLFEPVRECSDTPQHC